MSIDLEVDKESASPPSPSTALRCITPSTPSTTRRYRRRGRPCDDPQIRCELPPGPEGCLFSAGADIKSVLTMTQNWSTCG